MAYSKAPFGSTRSRLITVFVGLNRWYLGFPGSRSKLSAMVQSVYIVKRLRFFPIHEGHMCTFSEAAACSFELGRKIPGSTIRRNVCRRSCSAACCAAERCCGDSRARRSAAAATAVGLAGGLGAGESDMTDGLRCTL
jgi:hypothetical protein